MSTGSFAELESVSHRYFHSKQSNLCILLGIMPYKAMAFLAGWPSFIQKGTGLSKSASGNMMPICWTTKRVAKIPL